MRQNDRQETLTEEIQEYQTDFLAVIMKRLGIEVRHQNTEMMKTIAEACRKFKCKPKEYLLQLRVCPENSPLLEHLVLGVTIGETYFFRDKHQMELLRGNILPALIDKKRKENNLSLRIWSAGCSSGEEIYTISMLLRDLLPDYSHWMLKLIGTDINTKSLKKAMSAEYTTWSMRSIPPYYKERYFSQEKNLYLLSPEIRDAVDFFYLNLNEDVYPSIFNNTNAQDLIICRNVLIYFNQSSIAQMMKRMYACLIPGGYLLLGASDPIYMGSQALFTLKNGALTKSDPQMMTPSEKPASKSAPKVDWKSLTFPSTASPSKKIPPLNSRPGLGSMQQQMQQLQNEGKWQELLGVVKQLETLQGSTPELLASKATAHANLGQLDIATTLCKQSLADDPTNKYTWLTYSLILSELNLLKEAEAALRKALFLDHQFVVGHFQLGLLLLRSKAVNQGLKSLRNALSITKQADQSKLVLGSQGLSYGVLGEILEHEIELYERISS